MGQPRTDLDAGWQAHHVQLEPSRRAQPVHDGRQWADGAGASDDERQSPAARRVVAEWRRARLCRAPSADGTRHLAVAAGPSHSPGTAVRHHPVRRNGAGLSPDGRWMAYVSNESGRNEIYVRAVDAPSQWRRSRARAAASRCGAATAGSCSTERRSADERGDHGGNAASRRGVARRFRGGIRTRHGRSPTTMSGPGRSGSSCWVAAASPRRPANFTCYSIGRGSR